MEVNSSPSLASPDVFLPILTSAPSRKSSDKCLGLMLNPGTWREGHWEQESSTGSVQRYVNIPVSCSSSVTGRHQHAEVHLHLTERGGGGPGTTVGEAGTGSRSSAGCRHQPRRCAAPARLHARQLQAAAPLICAHSEPLHSAARLPGA